MDPRPGSGRPGHIPALTGIRGVAALWVVLHHLFYDATTRWLTAGYLAVDLFFVLSGFVLAHVYLDGVASWRSADHARFLRLRFARVYPIHAITTLALVLVVAALPELPSRYTEGAAKFSLDALIGCLLLLQSWIHWPPMSWNAPSWSLSAEMFFYLVFPWIARPASRIARAPVAAGIAVLALVTLVIVFRLKGVEGLDGLGTPSLARVTLEAAAGVLLCRAGRIAPPRSPGTLEIASLAAIVAAIQVASLEVLAAFGFAGLVLAASQPSSRSARVLSRPALVWLGEISLSLYLTHWTLVQLYDWASGRAGLGSTTDVAGRLALVVLAIAVAATTHRFVERPLTRWLR